MLNKNVVILMPCLAFALMPCELFAKSGSAEAFAMVPKLSVFTSKFAPDMYMKHLSSVPFYKFIPSETIKPGTEAYRPGVE